MTSTARVLQAHAAAGLATALLLLAAYTLFALVQAGPASWIAGRALPLPASGLSLPVGPLLWWLPAAILAQHWLLVASLPGAAIRRTLTLLGAVLLAGLWLLLLARHDRTLSAWQATLLLAIAVGCARTWRHGLLLALAYAGLAALTWGAIWGEQRCDESGPVGCLVSSGLRVQVPQALAAAGLPAFAQLAGQDLRGAKLSGRDLRYADLRGADLRGADFSGSNLRRARLAGADA
ncbi:MAG: pentapeptide repeat-containing protein, partial [Rubrivivax sp.]|nr:pentapeptide repeat-containing protein [Rubrivivax sp.]